VTKILIAVGCTVALLVIPKAVAWMRGLRDPEFHTKSARANEALTVLASFALHLVQSRITETVLDTVVQMVSGGSSAEAIGSYLVGALGKPLLDDTIKGAGALLGEELPILLGGQAATEAHALKRLGLAAVHAAGTAKLTTTLASGRTLVQPA